MKKILFLPLLMIPTIASADTTSRFLSKMNMQYWSESKCETCTVTCFNDQKKLSFNSFEKLSYGQNDSRIVIAMEGKKLDIVTLPSSEYVCQIEGLDK